MKRSCIAIVDAARARIYTYQQIPDDERVRAGLEAGDTMHEEIDLVNPGRRGHERFSTQQGGAKRALNELVQQIHLESLSPGLTIASVPQAAILGLRGGGEAG